MASVRIANKKVWVDDVSIPLLSGEIHYWRLDPANWHPVLQRARELGLQVIATYVCWDFHEIEPGRYDFRGETDPRRRILFACGKLRRRRHNHRSATQCRFLGCPFPVPRKDGIILQLRGAQS